MENLYTIKSVEISSRSVAKGEKTSITQKIDERPYALGDIKNLVQQTFDMIISQYGKDFFQKLVVTMTYSPVGTNLQHCIQSGHDEEGEIYCS